MKKNKYEISLWEDRIVPKTGEGENIIPEHYEEEKICVIGSDTMTSQARALEPKLVRNINGTNKLTFKLYYTYIDNETGKKAQNPFTSLLVNERKVKCKWDDEWYDFVVKGIQEDSNGKTFTYTCEDLYINELSKTGFSLEFDQELNNNQGTAQELAQKVLDGTDWVVDTDNSDHILQTIEEPLYRVQIGEGKELIVTDKNGNPQTFQNKEVIYLFYSVVQEKKSYIQFIYNTSYETENNSQLLKENNCYSVEMDWSDFEGLLDSNMGIVFSDYRGKRLVRKQLQEFNSVLNRNCYVYKDQNNNNKVLGYSTVEYKDPTVVLNLISNSKEFKDTTGWQGGGLGWELYPPFFSQENIDDTYSSTTYLKTSGGTLFNSGLQDSSGYLEEGLQAGQKYILRIKAYKLNGDAPSSTVISEGTVNFEIFDYFNSVQTVDIPAHNETSYCKVNSRKKVEYFYTTDTTVQEGKTYYSDNQGTELGGLTVGQEFPEGSLIYEKGEPLVELEIEIISSIPRKDITAGYIADYQGDKKMAHPGIFITLPSCWIKEIQFYQRVEGYNGKVIHLGDLDTQSIGTTYYKYFLPNDSYKKAEDIVYLHYGTTKLTGLSEVYEEKDKDGNITHALFEKVRSITAKNSNRFNILQSIAETFQCWIRFKIEHDENTGRIIYENGSPKKSIYFKEEIGEELGYGFVYGIDLKTISRSIDSNQLTTKVVVAPNTNEYAENGICRIADADLNENGENYILDFGYYISQGLLNSGELNKYLYLPEGENSGFYVQLKKKNTEYVDITSKLVAKKTELLKQSSLQDIYDHYVTDSASQITTLQDDLRKLAGFSDFNDEAILGYLKNNPDNEEVKNTYTNLITQQHKRESFQESLELLEKSVKELTKVVDGYETRLKEINNEKADLEKAFYKKFSRFIQEGSWTSQDYLDPTLYYLDARSVAYTSSRPKISYNISVIRLNALDEYKGKRFKVGDISFIEDKEFFGYIEGTNAWKTPYHEKVLISESTSWFDSPEKDTFTIQNYKTQFEDLFQRITATTQSLQYSTGEYNRASSVIEGQGVINTETLQNSININNELVFKSQNEEVFQDSTGLTLTDKRDPSKRTKLTSGGLFISTDGGVTWKNAIRGEGVATQYLTSGSINTNNISIYDGAHSTFRWDKYGINAFDANRDEVTGALRGVTTNTFVRFDQYGIYGIKDYSEKNFDPQIISNGKSGEDKIWNEANFGLTWKGFFLKNKSADKNQQIEISTEKDICVSKKIDSEVVDKIRIGQITTKDNKVTYGLQLKDDTGAITMETDDSGQLWLRDKLQISNNVSIGNLKEEEDKIQVFNSNDNFIIYDDGSVKATEGTFSGDISAATGKIGGFTISETELSGEGVTLSPFGVTIVKNGTLVILGDKNEEIFSANKREYRLTLDESPQKEKSYYKYEGGTYVLLDLGEKTSFPEGLEIYEIVHKTVFAGELNGASGTFTGELKGATGNFNGSLTAATGSFTGEISATGGSIGGFQIRSDKLESTNGSIILNGIEGKIIAENIELGNGAEVKDQISFKKEDGTVAYLQNPSLHDGVVLEAGQLKLRTSGVLEFGDIKIFGDQTNPTIKSSLWTIDKDKATFNNIIAQGGTIENVVFKNSSVQGAGGLMFFKPSYSATYDDENKVFLVEEKGLSVGDHVVVNGQEGNISQLDETQTPYRVTIEGITEVEKNKAITIIKLYNKSIKDEKTVLSDSLLIGINSLQVEGGRNSDCNLFKGGITVSAPLITEDSSVVYPSKPNLFIGDLSSITGKSGYGLYGDNVYLNGTLTTKVPSEGNSTYAGVNTLDGVQRSKDDSQKIVFWAGSSSDSAEAIQNAPFQVTDKGNLFAKAGTFKDSVFTDSTITGSKIYGAEIYTASIHGWQGSSENGASGELSIYNTSKGIVFREEEKNNKLFIINGNGLKTPNKNFITIATDTVDFFGNSFSAEATFDSKKEETLLFKNGISYSTTSSLEESTRKEGIFFSRDKISISILDSKTSSNTIGEVSIEEDKITSNGNFLARKNILFGDSIEYKKVVEKQKINEKDTDVEIGYDLYIKTSASTLSQEEP